MPTDIGEFVGTAGEQAPDKAIAHRTLAQVLPAPYRRIRLAAFAAEFVLRRFETPFGLAKGTFVGSLHRQESISALILASHLLFEASELEGCRFEGLFGRVWNAKLLEPLLSDFVLLAEGSPPAVGVLKS